MPALSHEATAGPAGVPTEFYCEHSASRSRVLALVTFSVRPPSLHAVLTTTDPTLAHRLARTLSGAAVGGHGPDLDAEANQLAARLPAAPAASFRQAYERACTYTWPVPGHGAVSWADLAEDEPDDDVPATAFGRDSWSRTHGAGSSPSSALAKIRVTRTVDLHVHDPERLRAVAEHSGWVPISAEDDTVTDVDDLVDAAMFLFEEPQELPGCDAVSDQSTGKILFATPTSDGPDLPEGGDSGPDFASLFVGAHSRDEDDWQLTVRTAAVLHAALAALADQLYDDAADVASRPIISGQTDLMALDRLPRACWTQNEQWRRRLARAADDLAGDLEAGSEPMPRCTAEEVCLHLALQDAEDVVDDLPGWVLRLPAHDDDYDWDTCDDVLFQDHDVRMLFDPQCDGIEDPDAELGKDLRTVNLHPRDWFTPFPDVRPRDPGRGFRR